MNETQADIRGVAVVHLQRHDFDISIARPSKWGNPFEVGRDGPPSECVAKYRAWLPTQPQLMADLHELRGKRLGCWCKSTPNGPEACHGDVLVEMANGISTEDLPRPKAAIDLPVTPTPHPIELVAIPKTWGTTKRICDRLSAGGVGNKAATIMFVATCPEEDDLTESVKMHYGQAYKIKAELLRGSAGAMLKDLALKNGLNLRDDCYYTTLVKWLPERGKRTNPRKEDITFWGEALRHEIAEVNPKIIVCLGKAAFDFLYPVKFSKRDLRGGFFRPPGVDYLLYPCDDAGTLVKRPELYGRFFLDFQEVSRMSQLLEGTSRIEPVECNYRTIFNKEQLEALVEEWHMSDAILQSVDCEWDGRNHVDGKLRSIQFAWGNGQAAYIRFMDDQRNFVFDCSYAEAGMVLGRWLNRPQVKYIGHHYAADAPWMQQVLGLVTYEKCFLDTEFALQCCDEFADLNLERLAVAYTDLGRYDVDLLIWKKTSKEFHEEEGYGRVPDEILIPYACRDVDTVFRAVPYLVKYLAREKVSSYYFNVFHPFVTDVFTEFAIQGLPMDIERMDELRFIFQTSRRFMETQLQEDIGKEAREILRNRLVAHNEAEAEGVFMELENYVVGDRDADRGFQVLKEFVGVEDLQKWDALFRHYYEAQDFNIRSHPMMRRWLFGVKGYEPVKSTKNDAMGIPSTPWERVKDMPPAKQALFAPAVDRQSLDILAAQHSDQLLFRLIELNAVGNLCKAFLKEAEIDPETGEPARENGLHFWLASDDRVHGQMSATETGRPRSWKPNCLNWPSYTREQISDGVKRCIKRAIAEGKLSPDAPEASYLNRKISSVRSCVTSPEGWVMVESDYATAEIRALAFQSGDEALIRLMTEPDQDFALVKWKTPKGDVETVQVRLHFNEYSGIERNHWNPEFLYAFAEDNEIQVKFSPDELLRGEDGQLLHPPADLHWTLAERVHGKPREMLNKKKDRGAAKIGNFSTAYGAVAMTLERKIEQDTGVKPEPGTGERILETLKHSRPQAFKWLEELENTPKFPGWLKSASGRKRRFALHPADVMGISGSLRRGVMNSQGREARNYYCQEIVAATAARASVWLLRHYRSKGMQAYPMIVLYDSVVTLCPIEERDVVAELHQKYMTSINQWCYHGRIMDFPIDTEINRRWSTKPTSEESAAWKIAV
jgi:uracil-DNA glycosylase family 4